MKKTNGFTLTETLIGVALLGVMILGIVSFMASQLHQSNNERVKANLSAVKARLLQTISSDGSWIKTVQVTSSTSHLFCIGSTAGCAAFTGPSDFDLYQIDGTLVYSGTSIGGFQLNGTPCSGVTGCPILLRLTWTPSCSVSDTNCRSPLIQVVGTFSSSAVSGEINLEKYSFTINRPSISAAACAASALPICGGAEIAICRPTGWECVATNPPYCTGAVSWNDALTSYGPCSGTVVAPGVLHNTTTALSNTASGNVGSANFLCIPGQPMNGFIVQPGATCAAGMITPALCGPAGGGTYNFAIQVNAAGLCAAGLSSPASVSGSSPWSWTCTSGASVVNCGASNMSPLSCAGSTAISSASSCSFSGQVLESHGSACCCGSGSGFQTWSVKCVPSGAGWTLAGVCSTSSIGALICNGW